MSLPLRSSAAAVEPSEQATFAAALSLEQPEPSNDQPASLEAYLFGSGAGPDAALATGCSLASRAAAASFKEASLLARLSDFSEGPASDVFLNTHEPFCFVAVGVQGAGKSHTLACVLEACLVPCPEQELVRLHSPMATLVLHYDMSDAAVCEATGLVAPAPALSRLLGPALAAARCVPQGRLTVLVSPAYFTQRQRFYGTHATVRPLLLRWHTLTADHIKRIMRIKEGDNQLYVAALLDLLRRYQRRGVVPKFQEFVREVSDACSMAAQAAPLKQRLALLESLVAESAVNQSLAQKGRDLRAACQAGHLVVVDLTDPLLSSEEANGVFQVLVEQFRALPSAGGKLLALDECHKYMNGDVSDGLSTAIVDCARLMRHDGLRLALSTQSPLALAPELLELVSVLALHRFHSRDWFAHLCKKIPLPADSMDAIMELGPGRALLFASRHRLGGLRHVFPVVVRQRITADRGMSRKNAQQAAKPAPTAAVRPAAPSLASFGSSSQPAAAQAPQTPFGAASAASLAAAAQPVTTASQPSGFAAAYPGNQGSFSGFTGFGQRPPTPSQSNFGVPPAANGFGSQPMFGPAPPAVRSSHGGSLASPSPFAAAPPPAVAATQPGPVQLSRAPPPPAAPTSLTPKQSGGAMTLPATLSTFPLAAIPPTVIPAPPSPAMESGAKSDIFAQIPAKVGQFVFRA